MNYIMIAKIVLPVILAALIIGKRKFLSTIPISGYAYVMAWLLVGLTYGCLWGCHFLFALIGTDVHWEHYISDSKWIIQSVIYALFVLFMLTGSSAKAGKTKTYKTGLSSTAVAAGITAAKLKSKNNAAANMNNIKSKVTAGISLRLDWSQLSLSDISVIVDLAKKSGATLTFANIKTIKNKATIDNMALLASKAPGQVKYETPLDASFDALQLAKSGAHFVCDNTKGSSLAGQIIQAAKESYGHVTFINCSERAQSELRELKQKYSRYMDFS